MKNFEGVTDEELALLYVKGNNSAFDELLSRTQTKLFTYIMFVVRDHDIADDIFQETFVKVITRLQKGQYTDSGKFIFWITRIAHNCIMDWYRQQQTSHIIEVNEDNDLQNLKSASVMDISKETEMINEQVLLDNAFLPATVVQGDCRSYRREHQHLTGTYALCTHQSATHGKRAPDRTGALRILNNGD